MIASHRVFVVALVASLAGGCGGGAKVVVVPAKPAPPPCVFPDSPRDPAPAWVCDGDVEGVAVKAVGSHEKSGAGYQFMKDQAAAAARVNLAQQMRVHVANMVKQYAETTGAASSETVDKVNTNVSKLITAETLEGSRVFTTVTSPTGTIFVLVGLDAALAKQKTEQVLRSSMHNDQAQWQQFKAKQGQDELAADIARQGGQAPGAGANFGASEPTGGGPDPSRPE